MSIAAASRISVHGQVSPGFEGMRDAFAENFAGRGELGGACCVYLHGEKVVDLWGGIRDRKTGAAWERDTMVLATGVVVGILWSAWHLLPNVWSARAAAGDLAVSAYLAAMAVGVFVGYLTAFRVLMVWVYDRTQSVLVGMLMHMSLTASLLILNPIGISGANLQVFSFAFAAALWVVAGVVSVAGNERLGRRLPVRRVAKSAV